MAISIDCPCGKRLQVSEQYAAQRGQCPSCGRTLDIPAASTEDAPLRLQAVEVPQPGEDQRSAAAERSARTTDGPWHPPAGMTDHGEAAIPADADFFVPPPPAIGEILSAYTSLRTEVQPTPAGTRAAWVIGTAAALFIVSAVVGSMLNAPVIKFVVGLPLAGIGILIAVYATRFRHRCTYVGREGVARFRCSGDRDRLDISDGFLFRDAEELRVAQTSRYVNGAYQGTDYTYSWTDDAGRACYSIKGTHKGHKKAPPHSNPYHYALASELAWSNYMLGQVRSRLMLSGSIRFRLGGSDSVSLGERKIILHLSGQTTECDADDIQEVRIHQGWFQVRRKDAREGWFSSTGIFKFPYGHLSNAQLFLFLLDRLVGVRIAA